MQGRGTGGVGQKEWGGEWRTSGHRRDEGEEVMREGIEEKHRGDVCDV